jgi:hypothetical protein
MDSNIKSYEYFLKTEKKHIDFINKIMEAYEGLGIVRTINAKEGLIKIITLDIYKSEVTKILRDLNEKEIKIDILEECFWKGEI